MNTHQPLTLSVDRAADIPSDPANARADAAASSAVPTRAESLQKLGKTMIFAGFVITIVGVVLYCAASFAGGLDVELGDILLRDAVPFTRATLAVLGLGTAVWLTGSFTYLKGAMDAEPPTDGQ